MKHRGWYSCVTAVAVISALVLTLFAGPSQAFAQASSAMALGLSWKGYADTDLRFSEFFAGNHTIALRFMPQFPNAYEGPFVAENGGGTFMIGQGDYWGAPAPGPKLLLVVGSKAQTYTPATPLRPGQWYHLAVTANAVTTTSGTQRQFTIYLNGVKLGQPLAVAANDTQMPSGTLRFGKRTTGQTVNGHNGQFYGFLDDVAVFTKSLSAATIQSLSTAELKGNETGLRAGYTFNQGGLPTKLARPITLSGAAQRIAVSTNRDSAADALRIPLPTEHVPMTLPFKPGEAWQVVQGYDDPNGSHKGYASFTWDFILAGTTDGTEYPNGSGGAPLYAAAPGKVVRIREGELCGQTPPPGTPDNPNILEIEQAPGEIHGYLHVRQNGAVVKVGDTVTRGQKVTLVGDTGALPCGNNHLHFGVADDRDKEPGFVTFPVAFSNYEVREADGKWRRVLRGIPQQGQVIRQPPTINDYDGDRRTDIAVYRPSNGTWYVMGSSTGTWWTRQLGLWIDVPVPGDYDGDGRTDTAVWRPDDGTWHVVDSSTGAGWNRQWGTWGDIPAPGDYDGDGRTDTAVWRPSEAIWYVVNSSTGGHWWQQWGANGDIPVPGDYDGDGRTDIAVWRPSNGTWYVMGSSTGTWWTRQLGLQGDIPVPGDYDGDGRIDSAVWRPSEGIWYVVNSSNGAGSSRHWGAQGDVPIPGDYDGDGRTDIVVWRPSEGIWHVVNSSNGGHWWQQWGADGDKPV